MNLEKTIRNLEGRGFRVSHFEKAEDAAAHIAGQVSGKTVGIGGSKTIEALGLFEKLSENNTVYWHWKTPGRDTLNAAALTDVYLSSANAISEDGEIVNIDGTGNRVAPIIWGPDKVIYVIGANKIAADVHAAYTRIKCDACPPNCIRLGKQTPCALTGKCGNCLSPGNTVCCHLVTTRYSSIPDRVHVILVNENLGF